MVRLPARVIAALAALSLAAPSIAFLDVDPAAPRLGARDLRQAIFKRVVLNAADDREVSLVDVAIVVLDLFSGLVVARAFFFMTGGAGIISSSGRTEADL